MRFEIPKLDLRNPSSGSRSIDDENGNLAGQLLYAQQMGRTVILLGKYRGTSRPTKSVKHSLMASPQF